MGASGLGDGVVAPKGGMIRARVQSSDPAVAPYRPIPTEINLGRRLSPGCRLIRVHRKECR